MSAFDAELYCSDEDVLVEAEEDFPLVVPDQPTLARGLDGAIAADSWDLTSATVDFAANLVTPGSVVLIDATPGTAAYASGLLGQDGAAYAVESVATHTLTLRQLGLDADEGDPPGAGSGMTGLTFRVPTLRPWIKASSDWLRRRLNFDGASDLVTPADLKQIVVYDVLRKRYLGASRARDDQFALDAATYKKLADEAYEEVRSRRRADYSTDTIRLVPIDI